MQVYTHFTFSNHGTLLCLFILEFLLFGSGRMGCDPHPSPRILKQGPGYPGPLFSGLLRRVIFALMNVSSAVIGEAIRSPWHSWPRSSGMSAGGGRLRVINHVSQQRCQSGTHLSGTYRPFSMCWHSPRCLSSFRCMVKHTLSPLFSHHRVESFHFLCVCWFFPCFIP